MKENLMTRRIRAALLAATLPLALATTGAFDAPAHAEEAVGHVMHVTKTPTCGCCGAWVDLAREAGFAVEVTDTDDYAGMKEAGDVPDAMQSCHTTRVGGYTVEGHVPFAAVRKLLKERPAISGIAVPGMPMGSPGMGDDPAARFDVLAFGGEAKPGEVFHKAGEKPATGWFDRLLGE